MITAPAMIVSDFMINGQTLFFRTSELILPDSLMLPPLLSTVPSIKYYYMPLKRVMSNGD